MAAQGIVVVRKKFHEDAVLHEDAGLPPSDAELVTSTADSSVALPRIGLGYDSHRLGSGGPLRIGGIDVASDFHAIGHSDADVLLHALTDALLGAICAGDIGRLFPDDAKENEGRDSADFLLAAAEKVREAGMRVGNIDCVILAQRPKMAPHIDTMRQRIASLLGVDVSQVGIKAKTGEGVGEIGTSQAIAARVVTLLAPS